MVDYNPSFSPLKTQAGLEKKKRKMDYSSLRVDPHLGGRPSHKRESSDADCKWATTPPPPERTPSNSKSVDKVYLVLVSGREVSHCQGVRDADMYTSSDIAYHLGTCRSFCRTGLLNKVTDIVCDNNTTPLLMYLLEYFEYLGYAKYKRLQEELQIKYNPHDPAEPSPRIPSLSSSTLSLVEEMATVFEEIVAKPIVAKYVQAKREHAGRSQCDQKRSSRSSLVREEIQNIDVATSHKKMRSFPVSVHLMVPYSHLKNIDKSAENNGIVYLPPNTTNNFTCTEIVGMCVSAEFYKSRRLKFAANVGGRGRDTNTRVVIGKNTRYFNYRSSPSSRRYSLEPHVDEDCATSTLKFHNKRTAIVGILGKLLKKRSIVPFKSLVMVSDNGTDETPKPDSFSDHDTKTSNGSALDNLDADEPIDPYPGWSVQSRRYSYSQSESYSILSTMSEPVDLTRLEFDSKEPENKSSGATLSPPLHSSNRKLSIRSSSSSRSIGSGNGNSSPLRTSETSQRDGPGFQLPLVPVYTSAHLVMQLESLQCKYSRYHVLGVYPLALKIKLTDSIGVRNKCNRRNSSSSSSPPRTGTFDLNLEEFDMIFECVKNDSLFRFMDKSDDVDSEKHDSLSPGYKSPETPALSFAWWKCVVNASNKLVSQIVLDVAHRKTSLSSTSMLHRLSDLPFTDKESIVQIRPMRSCWMCSRG